MTLNNQGVPIEADSPEVLLDDVSDGGVLNLFIEDELDDLVAELVAALTVAHDVAAERDFLNSLIDGGGNLLTMATFPRLERMFAKYEGDADMTALLEQAAQAYGDAAFAEAQRLLKKAD